MLHQTDGAQGRPKGTPAAVDARQIGWIGRRGSHLPLKLQECTKFWWFLAGFWIVSDFVLLPKFFPWFHTKSSNFLHFSFFLPFYHPSQMWKFPFSPFSLPFPSSQKHIIKLVKIAQKWWKCQCQCMTIPNVFAQQNVVPCTCSRCQSKSKSTIVLRPRVAPNCWQRLHRWVPIIQSWPQPGPCPWTWPERHWLRRQGNNHNRFAWRSMASSLSGGIHNLRLALADGQVGAMKNEPLTHYYIHSFICSAHGSFRSKHRCSLVVPMVMPCGECRVQIESADGEEQQEQQKGTGNSDEEHSQCQQSAANMDEEAVSGGEGAGSGSSRKPSTSGEFSVVRQNLLGPLSFDDLYYIT